MDKNVKEKLDKSLAEFVERLEQFIACFNQPDPDCDYLEHRVEPYGPYVYIHRLQDGRYYYLIGRGPYHHGPRAYDTQIEALAALFCHLIRR